MRVPLQLVGVVGTVVVILTVHGSTNRDVPTHRDDSNLKSNHLTNGGIRNYNLQLRESFNLCVV